MRFSILISLLLFSGLVSASEDKWRAQIGSNMFYGETPEDVCEQAREYRDTVDNPNEWPVYIAKWEVGQWVNNSTHPFVPVCHIRQDRSKHNMSDRLLNALYIYPQFGACPDGQPLDTNTWQCPNNCASTIGDTLLVRGPDSPVFTSNGVNYIAGSARDVDDTCSSSCKYQPLSDFGASCYFVAGSTTTGYCNYIVMGTGESCSGFNLTPGDTSGDPLNSPPDPSDPDDPEPEPDPCHGVPGYAWNGTTCVQVPGDGGGDGDGDGGGNDGGGGTPGGGNGGGSGPGSGGGGGDGSGGTPGGGDGGGGTPGPGDGGGSGPGSGGGDGDGDGEGEDEEGGTKPSGSCDTPPSTTGDPVQAAVVMQVWHSMCYGEELTSSQLESGLSGAGFTNADELDDYLIDNAEDIDNTISSVVSGVFTSGPSNACPLDDATINTRWGTITLPWTMSCPIFNVISQVMFWFSYLAAGWILYNALARSD